ncbi:MAG: DUF6261 family protein [Mangrovibacterium sp.]
MTTRIKYTDRHIRNGEMLSLAEAIHSQKTLLKESTDEHLMELMDSIGDKCEAQKSALNKLRVKSNRLALRSEEISAFQNLYHLVKGFSGLKKTAVSKPAKELLKLLNHYYKSIVSGLGQKEIHSHVTSLLDDLESEPMQAAISALIYCDEAIAELQSVQASCLAEYTDYRIAREKQIAEESATELTQELLELINHDLVDYLNAMRKVKTVDYTEFSLAVASLIREHNIISRTRKTRAERKSGEA